MTNPRILNEPDRVGFRGEPGEEVAQGRLDGWYENVSEQEQEEFKASFNEQFEFPGKQFMANPQEDYYQGIEFMTVIRRKSDGRLFGFQYWEDISKHGESYIEPNGDKHGFEYDLESEDEEDWYVFTPVEPFTITGYKHMDGAGK